MKTILICGFVIGIFLIQDAYCSSEVTTEGITLNRVADVFVMYQILHPGQTPSNWEQINELYDLKKINSNLASSHGYSVQDRYEFVTQSLPLSDGSDCQVLLIRTIPLQRSDETDSNLERQWRYLIYKSKEGKIFSTRISENQVQDALKQAGVTIAPKTGLPQVDVYRPKPSPPPTPNPGDAAFLAQYPQYDPLKNPKAQRPPQSLIDEYKKAHNVAAPVVTETPHELTHVKEQPPITIIEKTESPSNWKLWVGFVVVTLVAGTALWKYLQNRK